MGWFTKDEEKDVPKLPELPELPTLPSMRQRSPEPLHQLPSFPSSSLGEKFSQNMIKEAVTGEKEDEEDETEDFEDEEEISRPLQKISSRRTTESFAAPFSRTRKAEPIFIRMDKFEESLHIFEKTKEKIIEMEKMLSDISRIKQEEEKELEHWENEIQSIKEEIEKVDKDIFSKIE